MEYEYTSIISLSILISILVGYAIIVKFLSVKATKRIEEDD